MKQIEHLNVCAVLTPNRIAELDPSSLDPPSLFEELEWKFAATEVQDVTHIYPYFPRFLESVRS